MSSSNLSEITTTSVAADDEDGKSPDSGHRTHSRNSNSPSRLSFSSPLSSFGSLPRTQFSISSLSPESSSMLSNGFLRGAAKKTGRAKRKTWDRKKRNLGLTALVVSFFLINWWILARIQEPDRARADLKVKFVKENASTVFIREELEKFGRGKKPTKTIYAKLLAKAAHALAEEQSKLEPKDLWAEPYARASSWTPCAHTRKWKPNEGNNGFIVVTANGGMNQQRVAVCNAVAVARLLNATLVLPKFMYSSVWRDSSQFGDIYQEEHFINYLKPDVQVVKELPEELMSLDLEAIGSVVTDMHIVKEAKPSFYLKEILPILLQKRVVHFVGFGNRLASDPLPRQLQQLRCRCNFHALKFVPKIQKVGALLIQRMRQNDTGLGHLDHYLVGPFAQLKTKGQKVHVAKTSRYLALHLRFEIDMVAHSLCEFGGGEEETRELETYREVHFPALVELKKANKLPSPTDLRSEGLCPLMPEETVLMLAALGFNRGTHIYLAGSQIYGGKSRLSALTTLFPNLVTKENLLSSTEIKPFANFSSQLAALDFIVSTASDVFAMTDSGSQFSSLVAGYRIYYGGGKTPSIRPNQRRLADIFVKNNTIQWKVFETRVRKAVKQNKRVFSRPVGRSVYRYPRGRDCMCYTG